MSKQQDLASKLNARTYGEEITEEECKQAERDGLIVVFGASNDLCEFRGAFYEEFGTYEWSTFYWNGEKFVSDDYDIDQGDICHTCRKACMYCHPPFNKDLWIKQEWCPKNYEGYWRFSTNIPNVAEFKIYEEDRENYNNGLVINIEDLK